MTWLDHLLIVGTASTGLGGAVLGQITELPEITVGSIILALIGLISLWVRVHYHLNEARLKAARLRVQLEVYRRICTLEHRCPFTPDGTPVCLLPARDEATKESNQ